MKFSNPQRNPLGRGRPGSLWAFALAGAALLAALLVSCGGGNSTTTTGGSAPFNASEVAACEAGLPGLLTVGLASNEASVIVDAGPCAWGVPPNSPSGTGASAYVYGSYNWPFTSVTICVPGTASCQTIDHVLVDTGSSGLRIMSSVLTLSLPGITSVTGSGVSGPLIECGQFASGYTWGSVRTADVKIGGPSNNGETAAGINIQVIGDSTGYTVPMGCSGTGAALNDVASFGTNGVLGVGLFINDCATGQSCTKGFSYYFQCPTATSCTEINTPGTGSDQVSNPVAAFSADNNGVILELPALTSDQGQLNVYGTLVFGINTVPANNSLTSQTVLAANGFTGNIFSTLTTMSAYSGTGIAFPNSFFDSGSQGTLLPATTIPCDAADDWLIPSGILSIAASVQGETTSGYAPIPAAPTPMGTAATLNFTLENADTLLFNGPVSSLNSAYNDVASAAVTLPSGTNCPASTTYNSSYTNINGGIDWGLPVFFGKNLYVAIESTIPIISNSGSNTGPFWAY